MMALLMTEQSNLTPPEYLSPSSISTFKQCPLKFKYSRIDRMTEPPTEATLRGNFVHDVLEQLYLLEPNERTLNNAREIARSFWDERWEAKVKEIVVGAASIREFRWTSWWCIENLWKIENPAEIDPAGLEYEIFVPIGGVPVKGFIDRFTSQAGKLTISDYKTGKKPSAGYATDRFSQLLIYAAALRELGVGEPVAAELIYLKESAKLSAKIEPADITNISTTITEVYSDITTSCEEGVFATKKSKLCNWCHFKPICPAWQGKS